MPLDRRVERTRKLLLNSLKELLLEEEYTSISVKDITERANVGRSTFYAHFENKEQLFFSDHNVFVANLVDQRPTSSKATVFYKALFEHVSVHEALAKAILDKESGHLMLRRMKDFLIDYFNKVAHVEILAASKINLFAPVFAATIVELISNWLLQHQPLSIDIMSQKSAQICTDFIRLAR